MSVTLHQLYTWTSLWWVWTAVLYIRRHQDIEIYTILKTTKMMMTIPMSPILIRNMKN